MQACGDVTQSHDFAVVIDTLWIQSSDPPVAF